MNSGEDKSNTNSVAQNLIEQKLLERVEQTRTLKAQEFSQIKNKSFILQQQSSIHDKNAIGSKFQEEQELDNLMEKVQRYQLEKKYNDNLTWKDKEYWKYMMKNNVDLFSLLLMESTSLLFTFPLTTLKTRIQALHKTEDVCFFYKNNVKKKPLFPGISQGLLSLTIGNIINHSTYRIAQAELQDSSITKNWGFSVRSTIAFCIGDLVSSPFRIPFEVKRMLIQMNVQNANTDTYMRAVRKSVLPLFFRDIVFRGIFNLTYNFGLYSEYYTKKFFSKNKTEKEAIQTALDRQSIAVTYQRQSTCMIVSTVLAIVASNPIDVVLTRLACQQYHKYTGILNCIQTIYKEEGISKLFLSGFAFRIGFYLINGSIMLNFFDPFRNMVSEAYE